MATRVCEMTSISNEHRVSKRSNAISWPRCARVGAGLDFLLLLALKGGIG